MGPNNTNIDPKRTPTWSPNAYLDKSRLGALGRPFKDQGTRAPGNRRDPSGHTNFRAEAPGGNTEGVLLLRKCNICITVHWCTKFNPLHALTLKGCCLVGECFLKCVGQGEKNRKTRSWRIITFRNSCIDQTTNTSISLLLITPPPTQDRKRETSKRGISRLYRH